MAHMISGATGRDAYRDVVNAILQRGRLRSPRGQQTLDIPDVTIELYSPADAFPIGKRPRLSSRVLAVEALQLIGGVSVPEACVWASSAFDAFREPNGLFWGAYGKRIGTQLIDACAKLINDPETRQAVITLWDPVLDNEPGKKDYPCTLAISFSIRGDVPALCMNVHMRSNDVWLGLPYDLAQFAMLQYTVASIIKLPVGTYTHFVNSLHLYERNFADAQLCLSDESPQAVDTAGYLLEGLVPTMDFPLVQHVYARSRGVMTNARWLLGQLPGQSAPFVPGNRTEEWLTAVTRPLRGGVDEL